MGRISESAQAVVTSSFRFKVNSNAYGNPSQFMKAERWNPAQFLHWYLQCDHGKRDRIWNSLKPSQRRAITEWDIFKRFVRASGMHVCSDDVVMLDPNSAEPPPPDVACRRSGEPAFFEIGEVIGEDLAKVAGAAMRARLSSFSGSVDIVRPLLKIFLKKCRKKYANNARPLSLLLYYGPGRQASFWSIIAPEIEKKASWIQRRLEKSLFDELWVYDAHAASVVARFKRGDSHFVQEPTETDSAADLGGSSWWG